MSQSIRMNPPTRMMMNAAMFGIKATMAATAADRAWIWRTLTAARIAMR